MADTAVRLFDTGVRLFDFVRLFGCSNEGYGLFGSVRALGGGLPQPKLLIMSWPTSHFHWQWPDHSRPELLLQSFYDLRLRQALAQVPTGNCKLKVLTLQWRGLIGLRSLCRE